MCVPTCATGGLPERWTDAPNRGKLWPINWSMSLSRRPSRGVVEFCEVIDAQSPGAWESLELPLMVQTNKTES